MRLLDLVALVAGGVAITTMALAQQATPPPAAPAQAAPVQATPGHDDPNEIICHPREPILGSRLSAGRICQTRREWDQLRRDSASVLFHQQMERSANCPPHTLC